MHPLWWLTTGAVALRLLLFLGRGDYVAFDEGWYLVLGRNLMSGDGYTLSGLRHVALSPLFPILAGSLGLVLGDPVWAGRVVAALTAGLLVVPCWFLFRRFGGERTALLGCALVAVMPSLAPFVAPFWIGWDLWVGAEPVLHLFIYSGLALSLAALDRGGALRWALAGITFGLAFLARAEALIVFGLLGAAIGVSEVVRGRVRGLGGALLMAVAFLGAVAPYSFYLHDVLGRWALSGRLASIQQNVQAIVDRPAASQAQPGGPAPRPRPIDDMLWSDDRTYEHGLYSLDPTRTRLLDTYWGVPQPPPDATIPVTPSKPGGPDGTTLFGAPVPTPPAQATGPVAGPAARGPAPTPANVRGIGRFGLYLRALARIIPLYLVPLILVGLLVPRRGAWWWELLFAVPLLGASVLIATLVAVDPRTQLLIVPVAAYYAARGSRAIGVHIDGRVRGTELRRGFAARVLGGVVVLVLLGTSLRLLYLSTTIGSPHHVVGAHNRRIGEALQQTLPPDATVMSWHPALALFARRDWRVLPYARFSDVVRYADANNAEFVLLSAYYPGPVPLEQMPREYVLVHVPHGAAAAPGWNVRIDDNAGPYLRARVAPTSPH